MDIQTDAHAFERHPRHHGDGVAGALTSEGLTWLGTDKPISLNVIRHNTRANGSYGKSGFEIDADARTPHGVPHWIMRRPPRPLGAPARVGRCDERAVDVGR